MSWPSQNAEEHNTQPKEEEKLDLGETEAVTDNEKEERKRHRQSLKLTCLDLANDVSQAPDEVVKRAKSYYNFIRT